MLQERNFWTILLLSFVTCGIYGLVYVYGMTKDLNTMAGNDGKFVSPGTVVLLYLVTCGIYPLFWYYKQGNRMQQLGQNNGIPVDENGTTYLIWIVAGSFLLGIGPLVAQYLMIGNYNKLAFAYNSKNFGGTGNGTAQN